MYTTKEQRKSATRGKTWWTRVKAWWNNQLNPDHDWLDYDAAPDKLSTKFDRWIDKAQSSLSTGLDTLLAPETVTSLINSWSGAHQTGAQIEANEMSMQNAEDIYQRQVTGMQKSGLNPALMYQSGAATNAPTAQGQQGSMAANMSDLIQFMLLDKQRGLLDAQIRNTDANTDKTMEDTLHMKLINEYYPDVTQTQLEQMLSSIGVNEAQAGKLIEDTEGSRLDNDLKRIAKVIEQAKADNASGYYKALREYTEAQGDKEKAEKALLVTQELIATIEHNFMKKYDMKMGSSEIVAVCATIAQVLDIDITDIGGDIGKALRAWIDSYKHPFGIGKEYYNNSR